MNSDIINFYNNIDSSTFNNPLALAKEFLLYSSTHPNACTTNANTHFCISADDNSLDFITKRLFLISDHIVLTNNSNSAQLIYTDYSKVDDGYAYSYYTYNNNLHDLGVWLQKVRKLLIEGYITYIPNSYRYLYDCDALGNKMYSGGIQQLTGSYIIQEAIDKSKKMITFSEKKYLPYISPVLEIEVPIIDEVDLEHFASIALENIDELKYFQDFLKFSILNAGDLSQNNLQKIALEIQLQLNDIKRAYRKTLDRLKICSIAGGITTITAILFCIFPSISEVIKIVSGVGSGFGLLSFLQSNIDYFTSKSTLKDNNCYFLWALQR